jgi:DNA primase
MNDVRDTILDRIDIVDYISQYVDLKRYGSYYKGLCPFHNEKTPSFIVTPSKRLFHCFGCGAAGNLITFVMKYNNLSYVDALRMLAAKAGIDFEKTEKVDKSLVFLKQLHLDIQLLSQKYLFEEPGKFCLEYVLKRGFSELEITEFGLGIIPKGFNLDSILKKYSIDVIKKSGLFYYRDGKNIFKMAGRLLFPIKDQFGEVIAFSGRDLVGEDPKYINSPETPIFKKGSLLYNLDKAKEFALSQKSLFVVEGYFDVIRMWSKGYKNVVSSMGTAFTIEQAMLIKRYAENPIVVFDGDQAGINAAYKTIEPFVAINTIPEVVFLPKGEDPDSLLLKDKEIFDDCISKRKDLLILMAEIYSKKEGSLSVRASNFKSLIKKLDNFPEANLKNIYLTKIKDIFNIDFEIIYKNKNIKKLQNNQKSIKYIYEDDFLSALMQINDEEVVSGVIDGIEKEYFLQDDRRRIFEKIVDNLNNSGNIDALFNDDEVGELISYLVSCRVFEEPYKVAIINKEKLIYNYKSNEIKKLRDELSKSAGDTSKSLDILKKIDKLTKDLSKYNILEA